MDGIYFKHLFQPSSTAVTICDCACPFVKGLEINGHTGYVASQYPETQHSSNNFLSGLTLNKVYRVIKVMFIMVCIVMVNMV